MKHRESRSFGDRVADGVASFVGSWTFIGILTVLMVIWVAGNLYFVFHFDPFPFIFLNLFMSAMAAYSTPVIMMSQNRAADRDRHNAEDDYRTNTEAEKRIEQMQQHLHDIEDKKLDLIIKKLHARKTPRI